MRIIKGFFAAVLAFAALGASGTANAAVVINIAQAGTNVSLTASGTFDNTLATAYDPPTFSGGALEVVADEGFAVFGTQGAFNAYNLLGPSSFGSGQSGFFTGLNSGLGIGLNGQAGAFFIASSYINNSDITSSGLIGGTDLSSMGLVSGVYNYTVGGNALTVNIGEVGAVPEPGTWAMMLIGFAAVGFAMRRDQKQRTRVSSYS